MRKLNGTYVSDSNDRARGNALDCSNVAITPADCSVCEHMDKSTGKCTNTEYCIAQ